MKRTFQKQLELCNKDFNHKDYPIFEWLDDCRRARLKKAGNKVTPEGTSTKLSWLQESERILVEKFTDEFEAWLKIQQ